MEIEFRKWRFPFENVFRNSESVSKVVEGPFFSLLCTTTVTGHTALWRQKYYEGVIPHNSRPMAYF